MEYIPAAVYLTIYDSAQIKPDQKNLQAFINDVQEGKIHLHQGRIFSLDEIADAHQLMENNSAKGKLVVVV